VLANVPDLSEASVKNIQQYLRRGGGLMIFLGAKVNPNFYNEQLFRRAQLLPASLGSARGEAEQDERFFTLQDKNYQHPVVSIWNDPASGTLGSARFFRNFQLLPPPPTARTKSSEAGEPQVIVSFADGSPAVVERTWRLGRVVLFSSTADTAWNDLPVRPAFVPLVHRALGSIIQRQDEGLNLQVGERFVRRVSPEFADREAVITKPPHADATRDLRPVELVENSPVVQYTHTDWAGIYEASVADPSLKLKFAAQSNPSESAMEELSPAQLQTLRGVAHVINWSPNVALKNLVERERTGMEFWLPIAVIALVVAGAETFLGQLFSRSK
jgi:hypothetical protein